MVYLLKKSANLISPTKKQEIIRLIKVGGTDFASLLLTIIVILTIIGITRLKKFPNVNEYNKFIYKALKYSILNVLLIPMLVPLLIFPWRLVIYLMEFDENNTSFKKIFSQFIQGLTDIFTLAFTIIIFVGIFEIWHFYKYFVKQRLSKKKIFELTLLTFADIILACIALLNLLCLVRVYAFYRGCYDQDNKIKRKKDIAKLVLTTFWDTLTFPHNFLIFIFLACFVYRLSKIEIMVFYSFLSEENYKAYKYQLHKQFKLQLLDILCFIIILLCFPFVHRSLPALKRIFTDKSRSLDEVTFELLNDFIFDIPSAIMLVLIFVTIIRIPLMIRRKSAFSNHHIFFLCCNISIEILKDSLAIPFFLVILLTP